MLNKVSIRTIGIDVHKESFSLCTYCPESDSFVVNFLEKYDSNREMS
jgi:hypothetical protein